MTDNLTHNLHLLADEVEPATVDSHDIIDRAKARTRHQRAGLASALGTVAVATAMAATIGLTGAEPDPMTGAAPTTSVTDGDKVCVIDDPPDCNGPVVPYEPDERSLKFDGQLAPVISTVITPRWQLDKRGWPMYSAVEALQFVPEDYAIENKLRYSAVAVMSNGGARFELMITVGKVPPGMPFGPFMWESLPDDGQPGESGSGSVPPCEDGVAGCERRTLHDGSLAAAQADVTPPGVVRNSNITVLRPDGTFVQVIAASLRDSDTQTPPFSNEDLFAFADVFTY